MKVSAHFQKKYTKKSKFETFPGTSLTECCEPLAAALGVKQIKHVLNKEPELLLNEVYVYIIIPMLA